MPSTLRNDTPRRIVGFVLAGMTLLAAARGASAEDRGGVQEFFQSMFGGQDQLRVMPVEDAPLLPRASRRRPLTVRLHRREPRIVAAGPPVKLAPVSIFADRTLRRGDAVMMPDGIRIFAGSASWPYTNDDFVSLAEARDLDRSTSKVLAAIDRAPRS